MDEIECKKCGWQGLIDELVCSEEEFKSEKSGGQCSFDICPSCDEPSEFEDLEDEE